MASQSKATGKPGAKATKGASNTQSLGFNNTAPHHSRRTYVGSDWNMFSEVTHEMDFLQKSTPATSPSAQKLFHRSQATAKLWAWATPWAVAPRPPRLPKAALPARHCLAPSAVPKRSLGLGPKWRGARKATWLRSGMLEIVSCWNLRMKAYNIVILPRNILLLSLWKLATGWWCDLVIPTRRVCREAWQNLQNTWCILWPCCSRLSHQPENKTTGIATMYFTVSHKVGLPNQC